MKVDEGVPSLRLPTPRPVLTHVPLDPLVHEALDVHISNGILG